jgi:membrane protease YdiL (CAAX protease family)
VLFAVKNRLGLTLLMLTVFAASAIGLRHWLELTWSFAFHAEQFRDLLLGFLVMAASDGCLHLLLQRLVGEPYIVRYRALADYFRKQRALQMVAGGLLAGGEELLFRGVMLEGLRTLAALPAPWAVLFVALVFGLAHLIPQRLLWPFALWAVWEGVLLGGVFVLSGSLAVVIVLHVVHDFLGFAIFAHQRRRWATG